MTFVTKLTLQSGDRPALDALVAEIESTAERKGAEVKGPHSEPPRTFRVPQSKRLSGEDGPQFDPWSYTVYTRRMEIVGHDEVTRRITQRTRFPDSVHVEAAVETTTPPGRSR